jgi:hypothetical protein
MEVAYANDLSNESSLTVEFDDKNNDGLLSGPDEITSFSGMTLPGCGR